MNPKIFRLAWVLTVTLGVTLACSSLQQVGQQIDTVQGTAYAAATQAQAAITQIQGLATQGNSLLQTAQAFATQNPSLVETAQAFATGEGPAMLSTIQALATENPAAAATLQAVMTQGMPQGETVPDGIPVLPAGQTQNQIGTSNSLSYSTSQSFSAVVAFYKTEMTVNGWEPSAQGSVETAGAAVLRFVRPDKEATVTITAVNDQTYVAVIVANR